MKHLKMIGLAAVAVLGLLAFVGASTASATTLSTDSAGAVKYAAGTEFTASLETGTSATLTDTSGNTIATCTGSKVAGKLETATGTWVSGKLSSLTWESCSQTTDTLKVGSAESMKAGGSDELILRGSEVTMQIFGVSCTYGAGEGTKVGTITGGSAPTVKITATVPRIAGGFLCPSTGIFHAAYTVTTPHEVWSVE